MEKEKSENALNNFYRENVEMKRVAIFSGGGAKGLIQVSCIATLQSMGKKKFDDYDLIIGSSVGAINGTILALKAMTPQQLLTNYPQMLDKIFAKKFLHFIPIYDRKNFQSCWSSFIPVSTLLKECKIKMNISSVDVCEDTTHFFKSWEEKDGELIAMDTIEKSFAAPFFFGQVIDYVNKKVWYDGGCGVNNIPIDFAYLEAQLLGWIGSEPVCFDAYGTGFSDEPLPFSDASKQGFLKQLWNFMLPPDGGMARVQSRLDQVRKMTKIASTLPGINFEYYDIRIPKKLDKMDDIKHKNEYIEFGRKMAEKPLVCI